MNNTGKRADPADLVLGHAVDENDAPSADALELEDLLLPMHTGQETAPSPALWEAIEANLDAREDAPGTRTVRPTDGTWEMIAPGVERQMVFIDRDANQGGYYLRFATDAVLPSHSHDHHEHCVVLSGQLRLGRSRFGPGTYHFAERGHDHPPIIAEEEAMVFILGSLSP